MLCDLSKYFDTASATPLDERVMAAMEPYLFHYFANPNAHHRLGKHAATAIEQATTDVANALQIDPAGIIWTSGATESITTAISSAHHFYHNPNKPYILTSALEHGAVLESVKELNLKAKYLSDIHEGLINPNQINDHKDACILVTHHINNETGCIQNTTNIIDTCKQLGIITCIDATQSIGKVPLKDIPNQADYLILAAHKAFGPKGIGLLYANQKPKRLVKPILYGKSKWPKRPGTLPTALIVGFAKAVAILNESQLTHVKKLRATFINHIHPQIKTNINHDQCVPHIISIYCQGVFAQTIIRHLEAFALTSGSACMSGQNQQAEIIRLITNNDDQANETLRISLCHYHQVDDVLALCKQLNAAYNYLKGFNPCP